MGLINRMDLICTATLFAFFSPLKAQFPTTFSWTLKIPLRPAWTSRKSSSLIQYCIPSPWNQVSLNKLRVYKVVYKKIPDEILAAWVISTLARVQDNYIRQLQRTQINISSCKRKRDDFSQTLVYVLEISCHCSHSSYIYIYTSYI